MDAYLDFVEKLDAERWRRLREYEDEHWTEIQEDNARYLASCFRQHRFKEFAAFYEIETLKPDVSVDASKEQRERLMEALDDYFRYTRGRFTPTMDQIRRAVERWQDQEEEHEVLEGLMSLYTP